MAVAKKRGVLTPSSKLGALHERLPVLQKSPIAKSRYRSSTKTSVLAFNDINPQAPTHVLVIPKRHIASLNEISVEDDQLLGELVRRAAAIAKTLGLSGGGFRTVFNTNRDAGQTVFHVHLHLLGGRSLTWPPG